MSGQTVGTGAVRYDSSFDLAFQVKAKPQAIRRQLRDLRADTDAVFRPFDVTIVNTSPPARR